MTLTIKRPRPRLSPVARRAFMASLYYPVGTLLDIDFDALNDNWSPTADNLRLK